MAVARRLPASAGPPEPRSSGLSSRSARVGNPCHVLASTRAVGQSEPPPRECSPFVSLRVLRGAASPLPTVTLMVSATRPRLTKTVQCVVLPLLVRLLHRPARKNCALKNTLLSTSISPHTDRCSRRRQGARARVLPTGTIPQHSVRHSPRLAISSNSTTLWGQGSRDGALGHNNLRTPSRRHRDEVGDVAEILLCLAHDRGTLDAQRGQCQPP